MSELRIIQPAHVVDDVDECEEAPAELLTVCLVDGAPRTLGGVGPVICIQVTDAEQDAGRLVRAGEQLLPLNEEAHGVVVLDEAGEVEGVVRRVDLENAVLRMRRGEYEALARDLGLRVTYRPPAGDIVAPFVYWECPECGNVYVPSVGSRLKPPYVCRGHVPPAVMARRSSSAG